LQGFNFFVGCHDILFLVNSFPENDDTQMNARTFTVTPNHTYAQLLAYTHVYTRTNRGEQTHTLIHAFTHAQTDTESHTPTNIHTKRLSGVVFVGGGG